MLGDKYMYVGELVQRGNIYCVPYHCCVGKDLNKNYLTEYRTIYLWGYWKNSIEEAIKAYETLPYNINTIQGNTLNTCTLVSEKEVLQYFENKFL